MSMSISIKRHLLGCLEIPLFMKVGVMRFDNTRNAAIVSFIIPLLILFPTAELAQINPDFVGKSYWWLLGMFALLYAGGSFAFFGCSYACMAALERKQYFMSYINAFNWLNLTSLAINLPFFLLVYAGYYTFEEMFNLFIFLILFGMTYQAFLITYMLRINWMLGAAMAIMGMLIDDGLHKLLFNTEM